ncbi:uncharacterized protein LOC110856791 isoform X2 [Folsomia candida]|uniref:uncharacterized protein LOC110856791 isoform X2 n=1 Tax=Folsomia candida TaxID=158441 RepID=UPI000B9079C6|nr:uncharacterized protein LOC110856791 isoform X2 [Folsomia candida]
MVADGDRDRPTVLSVQKYESGPPVVDSPDGQLISSDGDTLAATKQEEWVKKKRVELTTTKQIETRVKRQIVLEDGKVVDDSGPIVTTNTTEDTDKQESEHTEHFTHGDDMDGKEGWVAVEDVPDEAVVKETNEKKITTHDEVEDIYETEEIQHLGDASNEGIIRALREEQDVRKGLLRSSDRKLQPYYSKDPQKRVLQQTRRHDRTTDIEDTKEVSKKKENGNIVTEITRRHEHEEFHNDDIPDSDSDEFERIEHQEGEQDYSHAKSENFIDYVSVPKGRNFSEGVKIGEGGRMVSENISSQRQGDEDVWDSVSERVRRLASKPDALYSTKFGAVPQVRPNVLTNRPLDTSHEEHTKRTETNRWLNSHFGSSSSSLNSDTSPRSPLPVTPTGIHVTMTSRSSPLNSPAPPPPAPPPGRQSNLSQNSNKVLSKESVGKRISFGDTPSRTTQPHSVHFDLKNRHHHHEDSMARSTGRVSLTKSGSSPWDEEPTPTPPPRYRRAKSPDPRTENFLHIDQTHHGRHTGIMNNHSSSTRNYTPTSDYSSSYLQKREDVGERKSYERREQNFGYNGPSAGPITRDSMESGNFGNYATKHSNYYKTTETDNPTQNSLYENGEAEVEQRKTVERRERVFNYDGPPQKQFHPKYIVGNPSSTMGRLKGIEHTGAVIDPATDSRSQTLPRRRFYFGDDQGSLLGLDGKRTPTTNKAIKFGADDINVSISNSYNNDNNNRKSHSLSRSMSFTPRSGLLGKPTFPPSSRLTQQQKLSPQYTSNPQLLDSPDLLAPKLLQNMSRSVRDVNSYERSDHHQQRDEYTNVSRSKRTFLDNVKRHGSSDMYDSTTHFKASSPARSINSPTNAYSPLRISDSARIVPNRKSINSPRGFGGANSPISDDYQETYRMSSSTPDNEEGRPRISTDTTSRFSRRMLRNETGEPAGQVESSDTTTRTKSRYSASEVMYPNGRRGESPGPNFQVEFQQPRQLNSGTVIIPVRDSNNNGSTYRK